MIRRPPRSTLSSSSAASDVYKRQMIDRQNICDVISEGVNQPATGFVPPGIPGFKENQMGYTFDLEKAKAKLVEAGYPEGKGLPILKLGYNTGSGHEKIAEAIQ